MVASHQLHKLIHSLDKQEKRYFKIYASAYRETSSYLVLFDFIKGQQVYDETAVKKNFRGRSFVKQLPVTKNQLHKLILKSMSLYRSGHSVDSMIREQLSSIDFLFEKAFYKECWKTVQRARHLALTYEKWPLLLEIIKWEKRLQVNAYRPGLTVSEVRKVRAAEADALKRIDNLGELATLHKLVSLTAMRSVHLRSKKETAELQKTLRSPLLKDPSQALSFEARAYFYQTWALYYRLAGNVEQSYKHRKLLNAHWEKYPHFIEEYTVNYVPVLQNLANSQADLGKYDELAESLAKFATIKARTGAVEQLLFLSRAPLGILYYNNTMHERSFARISELEEEFDRYEGKLDLGHNLMFYYLFSWCYFLRSAHRRSLFWINKILNHPRSDVRIDLHCFARIFNIMIHCELGNYELVEHLVKSARRFLKRNDRLNEFEETMLHFFKQLLAVHNESGKMRDLYRQLDADLKKLERTEYEQSLFGYFNFFAWTESKISNRAMSEIIKKNS